ncbi:MAG: ImmA/IrrE family metallo-endopeptidase [Planctomycetes bacterium]|nr:ImmA/IrrE family metallo-endopeptidase [Planctomycetota bacterium]
MTTAFNSALLETARDAAGLSQQALAKALEITQATISRWEHGLFGPSDAELARMAEVLGVPSSFFTRDIGPMGGGLPVFYHRALTAAAGKIAARVNARCFIRAMHAEVLAKMCAPPEHNFPILPADAFKNGARDVAQALRSAWMIGSGPIQNLVGIIESNGGIVIVEDLGCDEVDALCWWRAGLPKLFFINARKPPCRMRFSLAHELGHTIMHTNPTDTARAEQEADIFAAEFLMPTKEARATLVAPVTVARLASLKPWWKISMAALAVRAKDCGAITPEQLAAIMRELGSRGWRKREPVDVPEERPAWFSTMLRYPIDKLGWSILDLAACLHATVPEVVRMMGEHLPPPPVSSGSSPPNDAPWLRLVG